MTGPEGAKYANCTNALSMSQLKNLDNRKKTKALPFSGYIV